jgi:hypothetical protein
MGRSQSGDRGDTVAGVGGGASAEHSRVGSVPQVLQGRALEQRAFWRSACMAAAPVCVV